MSYLIASLCKCFTPVGTYIVNIFKLFSTNLVLAPFAYVVCTQAIENSKFFIKKFKLIFLIKKFKLIFLIKKLKLIFLIKKFKLIFLIKKLKLIFTYVF